MEISNSSLDTLVTYGRTTITITTRQLNDLKNSKEIRACLCRLFSMDLPNSYRIIYYNPITMTFVDLDNQLQQGISPFQMRSSVGVRDLESVSSSIHLFITKDLTINTDLQSQPEISIDQRTSHAMDDSSSSNGAHLALHNISNMPFSHELQSFIHADLSESNIAKDDDIVQDFNNESSQKNNELLSTTRNILSSRLFFSLDVKPMQKNIYRTDQFHIDSTKPHGQISRVQGVKDESKKMSRVLPRLRIPSIYQRNDTTLLVYVVHEEVKDAMRVWYKHGHKSFLPENYTSDTETVNPIEIHLNNYQFKANEDLELNLAMITKWNKSLKDPRKVHELSDDETSHVHPSVHVSHSPRLLCVLQRNREILWDTFCLSDFIRSRTSELIDANGNDDSKNAVPSESHGSNNYIDLAGDAESLEGDVSYDLQNTNSHQQSVQLLEDSNRISARIYFTHDVKPEQKNIYSSDKFNQKEQSKTNGSITCIQGIKNDSEAKRSIQPKLDIPEELRNIENSCLLVYVVSEKYENDFERDTSPINPIKFDWQELVRTKKGDYILKLPMVTLWNKLQQEEILYALDEQSTKQLHLAEHNPSARLLCVIERDSNPCWKTMCLSDFIRLRA
ncbi:hypothetical protein I4U23_001559 [Adineta vaga]|nr:hypothetical protein I4U23_001559 [Adineta vaga]